MKTFERILYKTKKENEYLGLSNEGQMVAVKEYLYTDTGRANKFNIALWIGYKPKEHSKLKLKVKIEVVEVEE